MPGKPHRPHGRIERGEEQVFRHDVSAGQVVEQRGFAGIGIADQGDHRPGCLAAPLTVQPARAFDLFELAAQPRHAVADQAAVGFDLGFARPAKEAVAAALALKVGPAAHQPPGLIVEMGEFDLESAFGGRRALAEDFEDQSGAVDHLALELFLEIALLNRGQRAIDDDQLGPMLFAGHGDVVNLALAEQRRSARCAHRHQRCLGNFEANCQRQPACFLKPRLGIAAPAPAPHLRTHHQSPRAAGDFAGKVVGYGQSASSASPSQSPVRSTGVSGWMVETACL